METTICKIEKFYQKTRRPEPDMALHTWVSGLGADLIKSQNLKINPIFQADPPPCNSGIIRI